MGSNLGLNLSFPVLLFPVFTSSPLPSFVSPSSSPSLCFSPNLPLTSLNPLGRGVGQIGCRMGRVVPIFYMPFLRMVWMQLLCYWLQWGCFPCGWWYELGRCQFCSCRHFEFHHVQPSYSLPLLSLWSWYWDILRWLGSGVLGLSDVVFCSFLFLPSFNNCLHSLLWTLLIFSFSLWFVSSQLSTEDQSVNGDGMYGLGHDMGVWFGVCGLGVFHDLEVLDELEETNKLVLVRVVEGHVDIANTRFR